MLSVLIIDDDIDMRFGMRRILSRCGLGVSEAASGEQAIENLSHSTVDLVFCDLRFPTKLSGPDILATIRSDYPDTKVVMMSCGMDFDTQAQMLKDGADAALQKPFFKDDCIQLLADLYPQDRLAA